MPTYTANITLPPANVVTANITTPQSAASSTIQAARDAYQLALAEGFVGTREEWLASLKGEPGADSTVPGPQGVAGTGKEWVNITVSAYNALTTEQKNDANKVYNLTDFVW